MNKWLEKWEPGNEAFWQSTGKKIANRTPTITIIALTMSFACWFLYSAVVVQLPKIGFQFSDDQLFWLAAMPGLAGGLLCILSTFLIPISGTQKIVSISALLKIIPLLMLDFTIMDPSSPYDYFVLIGFLLGIGGDDFSSYVPSTSLFFPKRLSGTALGIQTGVGNFGVSLVQLLSPIVVSLGIFSFLGRGGTVLTTGRTTFLENVAFICVLPFFLVDIWAWLSLESIPVKASFKEQLDILGDKHTWYCTVIYIITFGIFAGLSAAFPLIIKNMHVPLDNTLEPLHYAFYGPPISSAMRMLFGKVVDKFGGAILTHITGIVMDILFAILILGSYLTPTSTDQFPMFFIIIMAIFFFTDVGNAATFKQYPTIFAASPRESAGVIGWIAAVVAFGSFIFNIMIPQSRA